MYTKEGIVEEIKRVAKKLGVKTLKQKDFELNSTIPINTVKYFLGSWDNALKVADLNQTDIDETKDKEKKEKLDENKLLLELIRIYEETGEEPTTALVDAKGKFGEHLYRKYWKSLDEAFLQARKKFPKKLGPSDQKAVSFSFKDVEESLEKYDKKDQSDPGGGEMKKDQKIKFIPETIKPKVSKKKPRTLGEPIDFRGLKFAPVDKKGVIYLFGMVAHELGFVLESLTPEFPNGEGKRCLDMESDLWEHIRVEFEYMSSGLQEHELVESECDIIVCWIHDWNDCPVEVLELSSVMRGFEDLNK